VKNEAESLVVIRSADRVTAGSDTV